MEDFTSFTGKGIKGRIDGTTYYIGSPNLFKDLTDCKFDKFIEQKVTVLQNQGKTVMIIGTNKEVFAVISSG